jgi:glycosyltransferase involved in cell wall biosynthesis
MRRDHLDLLVTQYFSPPRHARRQLVVVHDVLFETHPSFFGWKTRWRNKLLVGWSVRRAGAVATVSEYSRREISRAYGRPPERICVIRNGVDASAALVPGALPRQVPAGTRFALMVGRLEPRKNLRTLLAAFTRVPDPDARLVVVGADDNEDPAVLAALAADERAIHLTGVPQHELWALYREATVFVFPSLGEGWGIPVLEALAAGAPVVASSATAIPEAGGDACTYFDPTGPDPVGELGGLLVDAFSGDLPRYLPGHAQVSRHSWDESAVSFITALRRALADLH